MKYVNDLEVGKNTIIEKYPELKNSDFKADNSGWTNFAIKVDNKYLFRFPRNDEAYEAISKEYRILEILNKLLPKNIKVPNYIYSNLEKDYPFVGYEIIQGKFLTKDVFNSISDAEKEKVLINMSEFLNILHSLYYKKLNLQPINPIKWYQDLFKRVKAICFKYFDEDLKNKTTKLFESFFYDNTMYEYTPTLVHGDLSSDHILITSDGVGVIDFGDLMVFDPAYDLIWAYLCGKEFYNKLFEKYKGNKDDYFEHRIRDFHIIRPPYDGIMYADEIKNQEMLNEELNRLKNNFNNKIYNK